MWYLGCMNWTFAQMFPIAYLQKKGILSQQGLKIQTLGPHEQHRNSIPRLGFNAMYLSFYVGIS